MQNRPDMKELIEAVQVFFQGTVAPLLTDPRAKFQGLIANNVLEILKREIELGEGHSREEWQSLCVLLGEKGSPEPRTVHDLEAEILRLNTELSRRIRAGDLDSGPARQAARDHIRAAVTAKLKITNPGYLTEPAP